MSYYYDEEFYNHYDEWWEEEYEEDDISSNEEEDIESSEQEEDIQYTYDEDIVDDTIVYTQWKLINFGDVNIRVSNTGKVQYTDLSMFMITSGFKEEGTPYRYVFIKMPNGEVNKFYVHDLIWRAFHEEDPSPGWEVRHINETPMDEENCYLNEVRYLDIYENKVCKNYKISI